MKKVYLLVLIALMVNSLQACHEGDDSSESDTNVPDDTKGNEASVDDDTLETLSEILETLKDSFDDWEGKRFVNTVKMEDPFNTGKVIDIETRVHIDSDGDRLYAEVVDISDTDNPIKMNYIYLEDEEVYLFESAESIPGNDNSDSYEIQEQSEMEGRLPDIETMFYQVLQFFPSNHSTAKMQGMTILDLSLDYAEDYENYEADVKVSMQSSTKDHREGVWSMEGGMDEVTIEMPIPSLGTVTFEESQFEDAVDPIDKSLHTDDDE